MFCINITKYLKTALCYKSIFHQGLVIAGLADSITRPPEKLSVNQCGSLAATGKHISVSHMSNFMITLSQVTLTVH